MKGKNKTRKELQREHDVAREELARLQKRQARTALHLEVLRQNVARPDSTWFVAGDGKR